MTERRLFMDTFVNRSGWEQGPWDDEPDVAVWMDRSTHLPCVALRHGDFGNFCGYVIVAELEDIYKDVVPGEGREVAEPEYSYSVHGGVTYSCHEWPTHEPQRIEKLLREAYNVAYVDDMLKQRLYWIGFDCAHHGDYSPGIEAKISSWARISSSHNYKTMSYVVAECTSLARQIYGTVSPLEMLARQADSARGLPPTAL